MFGCPPGAVGARKFENGCHRMPPYAAGLEPIGCPYRRVWRPEASMPGCKVGWLADLAGDAGWLAGLAGWLQLAGCCWLAAAMKEVPHARRSRGRRISMVDLGVISGFLILNGFNDKCGFGCIPNPDFCVVQPCRRLLSQKKFNFEKQLLFLIFMSKLHNLVSNRGATHKTGILDPIEFW